MIESRIHAKNVAEFDKKMKQLIKDVKNPLRANLEMALWLFRWVGKNFKTSGGNVGFWSPYLYGGRRVTKKTKGAEQTRDKKGRSIYVNKSAKLLLDTRKLEGSFHAFHSRTYAGIGSELDYAKAHDQGVPKRNLPARRLLPRETDKTIVDNLLKIYGRHVTRVVNR